MTEDNSEPLDECLRNLRQAIGSKPPYCNGTAIIPSENFILFYGKDKNASRINLSTASDEELQELSEACDFAPFGVDQVNVVDESYRKAGKLDISQFATPFSPMTAALLDIVRSELLEGHDEKKAFHAELYKLNVYDKGSFFKAHKDTPRAENMFGSLVVVFPARHEGGALILRHDSKEWTFDSAEELSKTAEPAVGYVAFYSDVEHEVTPVKSGHRVTLTYNLYFTDSVLPTIQASPGANENNLRDALDTVLADEAFLPEGGTLGFGLRHQYPLPPKGSIKGLNKRLKGSDAVVMRVCTAMGLDASVRLKYTKHGCAALFSKIVQLPEYPTEDLDRDGGIIAYLAEYQKGRIIQMKEEARYLRGMDDIRKVHWVTDSLAMNKEKKAYMAYGNEASMGYVYGDVCLIVEVGKYGSRQTAIT